MMQQRVHQCVFLISRRRVHHQTRRFVHHNQVSVLKQNVEWNVFGLCFQRTRRWNFNADLVACANRMTCLTRLAIDEHVTMPDQLLQERP